MKDIEQQVCEDIAERQRKGVAKYGVTVALNPLELRAWLQHAYEETLDNAIYLRRAIAQLDEERTHGKPTDEPDPNSHEIFGRLMWEMIRQKGSDFFGDDLIEDVLPLAEKAGLCRLIAYDPAKHGYDIEAEPGAEIWWWGQSDEAGEGEKP